MNIKEIKKANIAVEKRLSQRLSESLLEKYGITSHINNDDETNMKGEDIYLVIKGRKIPVDLKFHFYQSDAFVYETRDCAYSSKTWTHDITVPFIGWVTLYNDTFHLLPTAIMRERAPMLITPDSPQFRSYTGGTFFTVSLKHLMGELWHRRGFCFEGLDLGVEPCELKKDKIGESIHEGPVPVFCRYKKPLWFNISG